MIRTQIQLPEDEARALKLLAAERGVSMAALIRDAVHELISRTQGGDAWERALRARAFPDRDGSTDVSVNHDRYLDEVYGDWQS